LAVLITLGGCVTKAQQEVSRIQGIAMASAPVIDACWAHAVASPPHQALKGKMGDNSDALTLGMKTNAEKATPEGRRRCCRSSGTASRRARRSHWRATPKSTRAL
jgi:hypothetical protein